MAAGLAVVSTDLPGVRECVPEEQMPYLVPPADSETMAEKILLLAGNGPECRRLGKVNRRHIEEVFSPDVVSGRTCGFIESVSG
jgi:glycosyltransferase involved in cell wall biosynthesis